MSKKFNLMHLKLKQKKLDDRCIIQKKYKKYEKQ